MLVEERAEEAVVAQQPYSLTIRQASAGTVQKFDAREPEGSFYTVHHRKP